MMYALPEETQALLALSGSQSSPVPLALSVLPSMFLVVLSGSYNVGEWVGERVGERVGGKVGERVGERVGGRVGFVGS